MPLDYTYIFLIIVISSSGSCNSYAIAYQSLFLLTLSYALRRSINARPNFFFVFLLCYTIVWSIRAYSVVPWCYLNPA